MIISCESIGVFDIPDMAAVDFRKALSQDIAERALKSKNRCSFRKINMQKSNNMYIFEAHRQRSKYFCGFCGF